MGIEVIMQESLRLAQSELNNYKKLSNELNLAIMRPEEVLRWFKPQTATEFALVDIITQAVSMTSDKFNNLRRSNDELIDRLEHIESDFDSLDEDYDKLQRSKDKLYQEYSDLEQEMAKIINTYEDKIALLENKIEFCRADVSYWESKYKSLEQDYHEIQNHIMMK